MKDRFKFRCYNRKTKKMYEVDSLHLDSENEWVWVHYYNPIYDKELKIQIEHPKAIIMQSTGLKDKNGKLIYEGDIVNYDDRDLDPYHTPILNAVIEMRKYQWCMVYYSKNIINADTKKPAERKTWLGFDDFISSRIEVIGNIYKNKELLNENN